MQYILLIHNNSDGGTTNEQWDAFFVAANQSGIFRGGSEISRGIQIGTKEIKLATESVEGYMLFETDDAAKLHKLLELHPVRLQGGTIELCETPKT